MARTIADTVLMENVIAGPHPSDIATVKPKLRIPVKLKSIRGWRIGYSLDLGFFKPDRDVRENTLRAVETFRAMGCTVEEVQVPWDDSCAKAAWDHLSHLFGASLGPLEKQHGDLMTDYARDFAIMGRKSKATDFVNATNKAGEMYSFFGPMMENYDVFLCPTTTKPAVKANPRFDYASFKTEGKSMPDALSWCMTFPFNTLSRCPVLSVPSGFGKNGVPTGLQIVGKTYDDVSVFRAAAAFEKKSPWLQDRKHRPMIKKQGISTKKK